MENENENETPETPAPETPDKPVEPEKPAEPEPEDALEKLASGIMEDADVQRLAEDPAALLNAMKDPAVVKALPPEQKAALATIVAAARQAKQRDDAARTARAAAETAKANASQQRAANTVSTLKAFTPTNAIVAAQMKELEAAAAGDGTVVDPWSPEGQARFKAEAKLEALRQTFGLLSNVAEAEQKRAEEEAAQAAKTAAEEEAQAYMLKHPEDFSPRKDIVVESYDDEGKPIDIRVHMANMMQKQGLSLMQAHAKAVRHREIGRQLNRKDGPGEANIQRGGNRVVIADEPPPGAPFEQWREWLLRNETAILKK